MPIFTFNLPDIGEGIAEAEIVAWHVKVGDRISEDQSLADMMTDKATVEMESPVAGIVTKVAGEAGDVIAIGSMLVEIETATDVSQVENTVPVEAVATVEDELPHAPEPVAAEPAAVQERPTAVAAPSLSISADPTPACQGPRRRID
jgi:2-oxoisovalerate dehydrogenase E2 component (dihydrolipoyl transacylase)